MGSGGPGNIPGPNKRTKLGLNVEPNRASFVLWMGRALEYGRAHFYGRDGPTFYLRMIASFKYTADSSFWWKQSPARPGPTIFSRLCWMGWVVDEPWTWMLGVFKARNQLLLLLYINLLICYLFYVVEKTLILDGLYIKWLKISFLEIGINNKFQFLFYIFYFGNTIVW